ncbi:hypothetical protein CH357_03070 [Leptospira hartskeerlii]|uniref:Uncharacterized protein n=2 Tax=Leptospira hartskeerlii TaxID=2023177 RepID=A0A2M9XFT4_9LEPT|nr:hypothetical protein [Leptospira hartskeerlii]PJZ26494.1 hypothetical protein CH357_03070 [Leptospira hartskeerlii]
MTALLLLLGLLSAGAGAYTLFRDPNRSSGSSAPSPGGGSSGGGGGPGSGGSGAGTPSSADRGKLVNVGDQDSPASSSSPPQKAAGQPDAGKPDQEWSPPSGSGEKPNYPGLKKKDKLQLPHATDDIIRNNSRYAHHRRPLLHSEALVDKENFLAALEILKRTNARIPDSDINEKIDNNIQAIEDHINSPPEEETYTPDDPNYSGPPIPMGDLVKAIKEISQALGGSLSQGFANPIQIQAPSAQAPSGTELPKLPAEFPPGPVSYQIISYAPSSGPMPPPPPGAPISYGAGVPSPPGGFPPGPGGAPPGDGPGPVGPEDFEPPGPSPKPKDEHLDPNEMDLPEDTFFSDEWDKFKDLPLVDRRTGEDRRSQGERRGGEGSRKDRRGEDDRRKQDLFQERDDYLKKKAEEKRQEREEQAFEEPLPQDWPRPEYPLSDQIPGYAAPVLPQLDLVPIRLPDPEDKLVRGEPEGTPQAAPVPSGEAAPAPGPIELPKIDLPDPVDETKHEEYTPEIPPLAGPGAPTGSAPSPVPNAEEAPEIEVLDGGLEPLDQDRPESQSGGGDDEPKMIHGILELKPPEVDDAPFLTLTYDFGKIPHSFKLSKNYSIMEYSYYKYKPMLIKAQEFARRKMLKNALNYYRVIKSQNIPPELRKMINRNIKDITEFMEKYLMAKG